MPTVSIAGFNAPACGEQDATAQVQAAIDACAEQGGGCVVVPAGATRLHLGFRDGFEWNNNIGAVSVEVMRQFCQCDGVDADRGA